MLTYYYSCRIKPNSSRSTLVNLIYGLIFIAPHLPLYIPFIIYGVYGLGDDFGSLAYNPLSICHRISRQQPSTTLPSLWWS